MIKYKIDINIKTREFLLRLISGLSAEQLNKIPTGFNNNIIWNMAHLVAAQQGICYARSGNKMHINEDFFNTYKSGSKPEKDIDTQEIESIKTLMITTLKQFEEDYEKGIFTKYETFKTRYDVELSNIDDAFDFLGFHEGLHIGYIMAIRKLV